MTKKAYYYMHGSSEPEVKDYPVEEYAKSVMERHEILLEAGYMLTSGNLNADVVHLAYNYDVEKQQNWIDE